MFAALLAEPDCDILCVTEGYAEILPDGGHIIDAGPDWGYPVRDGRRKVLLWSKQPWSGPWSDFNSVPSSWFPEGRFVGGTTQTDAGPIVVVGACIPWSGAPCVHGPQKPHSLGGSRALVGRLQKLAQSTDHSEDCCTGGFQPTYSTRKGAPSNARAFAARVRRIYICNCWRAIRGTGLGHRSHCTYAGFAV